MKANKILINRAPVLTLWAAVVAERLGFKHDEALFGLALKAGGAGGLRREFEFATDLGFLILVDDWRFKCSLPLPLS